MGEAKREARWTSTVRERQVALLDEEASAAGISRQEMHTVLMTWALNEWRAKRLGNTTSREERSEAKPSIQSSAPPAAARKPAKTPSTIPAPPTPEPESAPTSQPAASTGDELEPNPFDALN